MIKLSEENMGVNLCDFELGDRFWNMTSNTEQQVRK
jgi:hypothetical protein